MCLILGPVGCVSGGLSESFLESEFGGGTDDSHHTNFMVGATASLGLPILCVVIAAAAREWLWAGYSLLLYVWPLVVVVIMYLVFVLIDVVDGVYA